MFNLNPLPEEGASPNAKGTLPKGSPLFSNSYGLSNSELFLKSDLIKIEREFFWLIVKLEV